MSSHRCSTARPLQHLYRVSVLALAGIVAVSGAAWAQGHPQGRSGVAETVVQGRILLMPRAGLSEQALTKTLRENGAGASKRVGNSQLRIVNVPAGAEQMLVARLARHPQIKFAEIDRIVPLDGTVNDPLSIYQWHLSKIGTPAAWDGGQGSGVTIAILDTGIDASHPDMVARLVPGWNFYDNTADTSDPYGHGTKVAGSAAAAMNNAVGIAGVSGNSKIMPIRIGNATGGASISGMAQGLTYASDLGVRVANISSSLAAESSSVLSAAEYMKNRGGLVFVSAGNSGAPSTAKSTTSLILVGATDSNDVVAGFSTYGDAVRLSAPGVSIYTTLAGGGYGGVNGTSFAAPIAAGVAALVMSANPSLSSTQVESILFSTALDLGATGKDPYYGSGRVDAARAVQAALGTGAPAADTTPPTVALGAPTAGATLSGWVPIDLTAADNVGVTRVDLLVNGRVVSSDTTTPFAFSWDSGSVANGAVSLSLVAYDAAGNAGSSPTVGVSVANAVVADTNPPTVLLSNPADGAKVGVSVKIAATASDDAGSAGIRQTLFIAGKLVASATGANLNYTWNTKKSGTGSYRIRVEARDAAGNLGSKEVTVSR